MSVLRHYDCITLCIRILGSLVCNISLISDLCLVLCCEIYRSTFISIMYPACMITVHDRKSRVLQHEMFWVSVASNLTAYSIHFFEEFTFLFSFLLRELLFIAIRYMV